MSLRRLNDISVRVLTLPASHNDTDHERCMINTLFALNKGVETIEVVDPDSDRTTSYTRSGRIQRGEERGWIDWSRYPSIIKV